MGENDELRWCASKQGTYSMKIGYKLLSASWEDEEWPNKLC